jgi:hypothetical protein
MSEIGRLMVGVAVMTAGDACPDNGGWARMQCMDTTVSMTCGYGPPEGTTFTCPEFADMDGDGDIDIADIAIYQPSSKCAGPCP